MRFPLVESSEMKFLSATTLLSGPAPSATMSGTVSLVVSCGVRLSEVGLSEIRNPQVIL